MNQKKVDASNCLMISQSSVSGSNPIIWKEVTSYLTSYWNRSPFEQRIANPYIGLYTNPTAYKASFLIKRKIPMNVVYYTSKAIGT